MSPAPASPALEAPRSTLLLRALAEPARWRIVEALSVEDLCVCHLVDDLDMPQPLVSHHLRVLREAGVVTPERYRYWTYYHLERAPLAELADRLVHVAEPPRAGPAGRRPCC